MLGRGGSGEVVQGQVQVQVVSWLYLQGGDCLGGLSLSLRESGERMAVALRAIYG